MSSQLPSLSRPKTRVGLWFSLGKSDLRWKVAGMGVSIPPGHPWPHCLASLKDRIATAELFTQLGCKVTVVGEKVLGVSLRLYSQVLYHHPHW